MAYIIPKNYNLTDISVLISITAPLNLTFGSMTVTAQIYTSINDLFTPLAGAIVDFAPLTGIIAIGTIISATANGLNVPITAGFKSIISNKCHYNWFGIKFNVNW